MLGALTNCYVLLLHGHNTSVDIFIKRFLLWFALDGMSISLKLLSIELAKRNSHSFIHFVGPHQDCKVVPAPISLPTKNPSLHIVVA